MWILILIILLVLVYLSERATKKKLSTQNEVTPPNLAKCFRLPRECERPLISYLNEATTLSLVFDSRQAMREEGSCKGRKRQASLVQA